MNLYNLKEDKLANLTEQLLEKRPGFCNCERCKLDVMAISLNKLKPSDNQAM